MPVAFSAPEREHITRALKEAGLRLFTTVGLKKTALSDLVADAGIVKSTFYSFFESKEALYLELLADRAAEVHKLTIDEGLHRGVDTLDSLRRFLRAAADVVDTDPLYRRLLSHPEELAMVRRKHTDEIAERTGDGGQAELTAFVAERQQVGDLPGDDPVPVVAALRGVLILPMHAAEFGPLYRDVMDLTIDSITAGLTTFDR